MAGRVERIHGRIHGWNGSGERQLRTIFVSGGHPEGVDHDRALVRLTAGPCTVLYHDEQRAFNTGDEIPRTVPGRGTAAFITVLSRPTLRLAGVVLWILGTVGPSGGGTLLPLIVSVILMWWFNGIRRSPRVYAAHREAWTRTTLQ